MKIFDCFTFFNETELLTLRLIELYESVDYFVLVESNKSHTGKNKNYIFEDCKSSYKDYLDKIVYVKVDDLPNYERDNIWIPENFQRNCIMRGLVNLAEKGDVIMVSDLDEIPNIKTVLSNIYRNCTFTLRQNLFYYYVNCLQNCHWDGTAVSRFGLFNTPQDLRNYARRGYDNNVINDGGWHYSYMGGAEKIKTKVENIAESHLIIDSVGDVSDIKEKMESQKDLWNRTEDYSKKRIIDITNNKPLYMDLFLKKHPNFFYEKSRNNITNI